MDAQLNQTHKINQDSARGVWVEKAKAIFYAAALGIFMIGAVGFASGIAHSAAHDTRHAIVFPCH